MKWIRTARRRQNGFKQLREEVVLRRLSDELERRGFLTGDGLVWGDAEGTALVEFSAYDSQVVIRKVWSTHCGLGYGTALMAVICEAADVAKVKLRLQVRPFRLSLWNMLLGRGRPRPGLTKGELRSWYARFRYMRTPRGKRPGGLNKRQLRRWYKEFGFVRTGYGSLMIRAPRPLPLTEDELAAMAIADTGSPFPEP